MPDASDTTRRRQQRMLFASKVIAETHMQKGYTNHIVLEGGLHNAAITNDTYDKMIDGTTQTTVAENTLYVASVPNRQPDPPTIEAVSAVNGQATIYFSPPAYEGISPVLYYRVKSTDGTIDITVTSAPAVVTGLQSGTSYQFVLYAVNAQGTSVASTTTDAATVIGLPSAIQSVTGSVVPGGEVIEGVNYYAVDVAFDPPSFDGGAPVTGYTIVSTPDFTDISGSSHGSWPPTIEPPPNPLPPASPIRITGLTNGVPYTFRVMSTNANGVSPLSVGFAGPFTPASIPDPPTNVTAIRGNGQATVQFTPPINNGGSAVTSYTATVTPGGATFTSSTSPITVTGLTNGSAYTMTVRATNAVGDSIESAVSNSVTPATVPNAPTAVTAVAGNAQAVVSFTAPADNGSAIVSYRVTSSPGGFTATAGSSPITVLGLTNDTTVPPASPTVFYTFTVVAINGIGESLSSSASNQVTPTSGNRPGAPTDVSAVPSGNTGASVSFVAPTNAGTPAFTTYTITSIPATSTVTTTTSPTFISGLTPATRYTFRVVATNTVGDSDPGISNQIIAGTHLAPVLTGSCPAITEITVTFTQAPNPGAPNITNYRYSLNGTEGPFTAFSSVRFSPATITGLTANTTYNITLRAVNSNGDSLTSNVITVKTFTNANYASFTTLGSSTWTAPAGVTFVEYLIVGGGGGGGGCYSDILVIGDVPFVRNAPDATSYWIMNFPGNAFHGYMFKGTNIWFGRVSTTKPARVSVLSNLNKPFPENPITPGDRGTSYPYNKWYAETFVYRIGSGFPSVENYRSAPFYTTALCNNISIGSGGGAGGQVQYATGATCFPVTPAATYTIVVGDGGAGGTASAGQEADGSPGGDSSFSTVIARGGSGGGFSRKVVFTTNGFNNGGYGGSKYQGLYGGQGGAGAVSAAPDAYALVSSGGVAGRGRYLNFDGTGAKSYGDGGIGGVPNTPTDPAVATVSNLGKGGSGTGALLNSFAPGIKGGSGIVILKWYT